MSRADTGLHKFLFYKLQHDRFTAPANIGHDLYQLRSDKRTDVLHIPFFVFKKIQKKKKAQEAAKPAPDADYVDDDEDYGYDPEFEDDDADSSVDEDDNEPV